MTRPIVVLIPRAAILLAVARMEVPPAAGITGTTILTRRIGQVMAQVPVQWVIPGCKTAAPMAQTSAVDHNTGGAQT